ncbi:MAG: DUF1668 domain-containing protein [Planctomycetales bacterium]|nr:DUF1668 domain-containing protein [Planctomycetales bacterium]
MKSLTLLSLLFFVSAVAISPAAAHFPWLVANDDGEAEFYFGESLAERAYHLPEPLAEVEVWRRDLDVDSFQVDMKPIDEEDFIGLRSEDSYERRGVLTMAAPYGLYHGTMLTYYAASYPSRIPAEWSSAPQEALDLQIVPRLTADKLLATLYWQGKPLKHTKVMLYDSTGKMVANESTNDDGVAEFAADLLGEGCHGLMAGFTDEEARGEFAGEKYREASHYSTTTFTVDPENSLVASALPPLPAAISSFGAAACGDDLYVYSGHQGKAHDHSRDNLSAGFYRTPLAGGGQWESLPMQTPLQGLALVAHGGKLYRVGGLSAANAAGEDADLHSVDEFACFDPATGAWTDMPALPTPRSSHDAIVVGDVLYVVGGWKLAGDSNGEWQAGAVAFDLNDPQSGWRELPNPPFQRRALSVAAVGDRLAVLCGMDEGGSVCKDVFFYDPQQQEWSNGPEFPGDSFHGFGVSACGVGGDLYACGMEGVVYQLANGSSDWKPVAQTAAPRFFHRLLPAGENQLLVIGGATAEEGHVRSSERINLVPAANPLTTAVDR